MAAAQPRPQATRASGGGAASAMEREARAGGFRKETVDRLLRLHFRDGRTRVNGDAQLLMAEMLKVFVREAAARAARQAHAEDLEKVDVEHVEKVLPQLLLDF
ncbi:centromere protein X isoform X2 [Strigops habroptila]|uniref:Centromere protein X n=1 Tax=Strigops habroptila TaxID=2489341 RepID=A0A672UCV1_STRHB|nr:centromere protein X isoform X2 [Strigops habroptila]